MDASKFLKSKIKLGEDAFDEIIAQLEDGSLPELEAELEDNDCEKCDDCENWVCDCDPELKAMLKKQEDELKKMKDNPNA